VAWVRRHRVQLRLATRMTIAALLAFAACRLLGLQQAQWAVLTAIIVMQASLGGSLKAAFDRFVGSLGGALWGVAIMALLPRDDLRAMGLALFAALAPLALLTAFRPTYRVAPITAVILLLTPSLEAAGPLFSAERRLMEIGIGSLVALAVAIFVLPARAHTVLARVGGRAAALMADLLEASAEVMAGKPPSAAIPSLHAAIRKALAEAEAAADEAVRERRNYLATGGDPRPLCRTLRRLLNDLSMIGRTVSGPEPGPACAELDRTTLNAAAAIAAFLRACGQAITDGGPAPSLDDVEARLREQADAVAGLRRAGATRDLSGEAVSRIFGRAFGFQQLQHNLQDLADRADELAGSARPDARRWMSA